VPLELSGLISKVLSRGYQLAPEAFDLLVHLPLNIDLETLIEKVIEKKGSVSEDKIIRKEDLRIILPPELVAIEKSSSPPIELESDLEILSDPTEQISPVEAEIGFKKLFHDRYYRLLDLAKRRPDFKNINTTKSILKIKSKQRVKFAGLLSSRNSKKGAVELTLDDSAGSVKVVCTSSEVLNLANKVPLDSLVIVEGSTANNGKIFIDSLVVPDIPNRKPSTASHRVYAVLLSDLHIGSRMFLQADFDRFILWLNGKLGELDLVKRVKYIIIAGDIVDGVGVYPGQEYQLEEKNLKNQYLLAKQLIESMPKHIQVLISPGNHDPVRQALPQPAISPDFAEPLYRMGNVKLIGNPSCVKLHGVNFLIYHGRSLDDIIATVPELSYNKPAIAMQVLLKVRHLAPIYGKRTPLSPELKDMLVIDPVPDVFHAGHVHAIDFLEYRGTFLINSGTWQSKTPFQANMGLEPTPSIVPIVDLSTLEILKRNFVKESFSHILN
jgi:DNA polymerase II small subunit